MKPAKNRKGDITHISINQLVASMQSTPAFELPDMDKGTAYLYHRVYVPLSKGKNVTISSLDFDAFDEEDIQALSRLYNDVFETNSSRADWIKDTLQAIVPVCKPVLYV